jgi:hypothetical protein
VDWWLVYIADLAPSMWDKVKTRNRNSRTVEKELTANLWILDIGHNLTEA